MSEKDELLGGFRRRIRMAHRLLIGALALSLLLAACNLPSRNPAALLTAIPSSLPVALPSGLPTVFPSGIPSALPIPLPTSISSTLSVSTVSVGTVQAILGTALPPGLTLPALPAGPTSTPIPTLASGLGPTELKYRLLAQVPDLFFCDPDSFPVARADEADLARQRFADLQANPEEFNAILAHNGIPASSSYSDDQKLLIYREHKKLGAIQFTLAAGGYQYQLQVAKDKTNGELVTGMISGQGVISGARSKPIILTCPICLAAGTLIDTPAGPMPVQNLELGMLVWTVDREGRRMAQPVVRVGSTIVPASHLVVHLELQDGRALWASPGHPLPDGRAVGQLQPGDQLDGSIIRSLALIPYSGYATYDLLPAGDTGFYWANGILLASTLSQDK